MADTKHLSKPCNECNTVNSIKKSYCRGCGCRLLFRTNKALIEQIKFEVSTIKQTKEESS